MNRRVFKIETYYYEKLLEKMIALPFCETFNMSLLINDTI